MGLGISFTKGAKCSSNSDSRAILLRPLMTTALVLSGILSSGTALAQSTGDASTTIVTPLSIVNNSDLNFGRIIPGSVRSILRIGRNDGSLDVRVGDAIPVGGTIQRAAFVIVADPLTRVQITLPQTLNLLNTSGAGELRVNRFRLNGRGGRRTNRNIDASGILPILVSAQLRVLPSQAAGIYQANYDVTVEYN